VLVRRLLSIDKRGCSLTPGRGLRTPWRVATNRLIEYGLLQLFRKQYKVNAEIRPEPCVYFHWRLDDTAFCKAANWTAP
jgi:hypothetical protein